MMDLHTFKVFQMVAKMGSISKAARKLKYAQSNISTIIHQLEEELKTTLFYRHNRGVELTDKGKLLLAYSDKILHLIDETRKAMVDDEIPKGPLVIGSMETTAAVRLPRLLSKYHQLYPEVDLTLRTGPTEQNVQGVLNRELDGAFVAGPINHADLIKKTVVEEKLVVITDTIHSPLNSMKDVQSRTLLVFRTGCSYRAKLEQWLHHEGIIPNKLMEFGTLEGIIGCVSAGLGISMLPYSVVEKYIHEGNLRYHSVPDSYGNVKTIFIYRKDTYTPSSLIKMSELINDENYE